MTRLLLALLAFYHRWLSPALHAISPSGCKFQPTCSEYAQGAVAIHGALRGSMLAAWRLMRCHPFTRGGFDPVPIPAPRRSSSSTAPLPKVRHRKAALRHEPLP